MDSRQGVLRVTSNIAVGVVAANSISVDYAAEAKRRLNQLCEYCGSLPVSQLSKGHVAHWVENQAAVAITGHTTKCDHDCAGSVQLRPRHA